MTIQILSKVLKDLMQIEEKINSIKRMAEEQEIPLPCEEELIKELVKSCVDK